MQVESSLNHSMLYDINPADFAHHVRHANSWNDLGIRCGLEKDKFGNIRNQTKLSMLHQKVQNMRLSIEHFFGQKAPIPDDDFKTIVKESTCLKQVMSNCGMNCGGVNEKILKRIEDLDIDISHFESRGTPSAYNSNSKVDAINDETFKTLVKNNMTWIKLALDCGFKSRGGIKYVARRIEMCGLDTSHFDRGYNDNDKVFVVNSQYKDKREIKKRLQRDFDRVYECAGCKNHAFTKSDGVLLWNNKEIVLQLEHKNGIHNDNRIDNLEFLCPSCHSQTSTFCGANTKKYKAGQAWIEYGKTEYKPGSIASLLN